MATAPIHQIDSPIHAQSKPAWPWIVVATGYFLPGIIGVCVRQYLASIGKPVMPWSWVAREFGVLAIFSLYWVLPFLLVALVAARLSLTEIKRTFLNAESGRSWVHGSGASVSVR